MREVPLVMRLDRLMDRRERLQRDLDNWQARESLRQGIIPRNPRKVDQTEKDIRRALEEVNMKIDHVQKLIDEEVEMNDVY